MIKFGARKKNNESLRPLTESEIQQKLYGKYNQAQSSGFKSDVTEERRQESFSKNKTFVQEPDIRQPFKFPKIKVNIPWQTIGSIVLKGFMELFRLLRIISSRFATGWGVSALVVVLLFLGLHALNAYRTTAMKNAKFNPPVKSEIARKNRRHMKTTVAKTEQQTVLSEPVLNAESISPDAIAVETTQKKSQSSVAPRPETTRDEKFSSTEKGYVIQVCTYAREDDAQKLIEEMKREKLSAFVRSLGRSDGKIFYAVFLGRFETFQEAQSKLKEFKKHSVAKNFPDSFVRTL